MPNPIQALTLAELASALDAWTPLRRIREVHVHCTDHPNHAEFRGLASVEAMRRFHMSIGMNDIAQHLTADPRGLLWTGRPFDAMPASVRGHNGTPQAGPFMIEMVGLFDKGKDVFGGVQKAVVQSVVRAVLRKFGLDETAVKFHREFPKTGKTCPGTALDPDVFRQEIRDLLAADARDVEVQVPRSVERAPIDREALFGRGEGEDTTFLEVPEDEKSLDEQVQLARWIDRGLLGPLAGAGGRAVNARYRELLPYVINTSQGLLSRKGEMESTPESLQTLIDYHLTPAFDAPPGAEGRCEYLLFIAHGGLNTEEGALDYAKEIAPWWHAHGVYPIFFIWESSLFQTIWQRPRELPRGAVARGDFSDKAIEVATQKLARAIWRRMKANARRCSAPDALDGEPGGLSLFWNLLEPWLKERQERVTLHALGHSTGPILLSRFMPLVLGADFDFETLSYLAPAIRIDDFLAEVRGSLLPGPEHGVKRLRVLTMNDEAERDDHVGPYRKSLLYYVREACEDHTDGRILGLEKDLYGDRRMRSLFGLEASAGALRAAVDVAGQPHVEIELAQPAEAFPQNERTRATAHGCFDNEEATMRTVLEGILGKPSEGRRPFPWRGDSQCVDASRAVGEEDWTAALDAGCCCPCHGQGAAGGGGGDDGFDRPSGGGEGGASGPARPDRVGPGPVGRRIALCVGINAYPRQPLQGCVRDSQNWAEALRRHGFEVSALHDAAATRAKLMSGLRSLIRDGRAGDQLVFQFSGHGSQVDDHSGDESDRFDEAILPVDFDRGALWLDDDTYGLCQELRPGATLTFLMDCCHSGTNTRFAPTATRSRWGGALPRFLLLNAREAAAHEKARKALPGAPPVSEREPIPGVVSIAACRDDELAWEEGGQGNFSRHSMAVLDDVLRRGASNREFLDAVIGRFGDDRRQRPLLLKPAGGLEAAPFLGGR